MKYWACSLLITLLSFTVLGQPLQVINLRCQYRVDPVGVNDAQPMLSWELQSAKKNTMQAAYRILVADDASLLEKNIGNVWDSKKIISPASVQVAYAGKKLTAGKKYFWKVMVWDNHRQQSSYSGAAYWQMGLLHHKDWAGAKWIAYEVLPDSNMIVPHAHQKGKKEWGARDNVLPLFRKNISIKKTIKNATAFICGLGHFEISINGKKTGDHFLDPGWTQYSKHAQYVAFDVKPQLTKGHNTIGVILGNGFYYIPGQRYRKMTGAYGYPKMIARIVIEYTDGTMDNIISNQSWKTSPSPVYFSSIFGGEDYDANREQTGWEQPGFNDVNWKPSIETTGPETLTAQMAEPLKVFETFTPLTSKPLQDGSWIFDMSQNASGIPAITVSGKKGDTIKIVPAELINDDGTANQKASGGPHYYTYILKGDGDEEWQPKFTYYGFRYLQVFGAIPAGEENKNHLPIIKKIEGLHIRNAAMQAGSFHSSNNLFNKTNELIKWAIKSNTVSVFTDCPHREKLGWLEQTHLMGSSVQYNYDVAALNKKVITDMHYAQYADGKVPEIAPEYVHFTAPFDESPEWGSAAVILPWYNYLWYGDKKTLAGAYNLMKGYVSYLQKKSSGNILSHGLGDWFDIGPNRPGVSQLTPLGVTATAMYYYDVTILQKTAMALNKPEDAVIYKKLSAAIKSSFNKKFFNTTTRQYATGSQAANAMALYMNLVDDEYKQDVVNNLVADIKNRGNALTAGDIGYRYVLQALEKNGRSDVIYEMNNRSDVPGYGYQLAKGATALTESWQAYANVSNNHFMLGHLMEWFYSGLCGIGQAQGSVGFNHIEIRPQPVGDIKEAAAGYHSVYGLISVSWKKSKDAFMMDVTIPANTKATIFFPAEYKKPPVKIGSGIYHFSVK